MNQKEGAGHASRTAEATVAHDTASGKRDLPVDYAIGMKPVAYNALERLVSRENSRVGDEEITIVRR